MSLPLFLSSLREGGAARVPPPAELLPGEMAAAEEILRAMDGDARLEAPLEPPPLSLPAARWGALIAYRATQCFVHRAVDAPSVTRALAEPCPEPHSAATAWSADLALRILPDLLALARGVAEDDPLVAGLLALARAWPLSSAGTRGVENPDIAAFADHPSLIRLYADRILERRDSGRLGDPRVREAVREALGAHPELAPEIARAAQLETAP